jgi:general secretion pathway protein K
LFTATGAEQAFAETLAARVLDWRDGDDFRHLGGAEDADYKAAGMPWTARDNRFSSIEELRYVLGMPPAMFRAISPYLTVYSGVGGVDFNVAPEFLIGAFGGASPMPARIGPNSDLLPGVRGGNGTYHINVAVPGPDGILVSSETVVRVARNAEPQYTVLNWRDRSRLLTQTVEAEGI